MVTGGHPCRDAWLEAIVVRAAMALACLLFLGLFVGCGRSAHRKPERCAPVETSLRVDVDQTLGFAAFVARAPPAESVIR